jgi:hypothetical protein
VARVQHLGFDGLPGHLANVLLHAGSGFLLYLFLARMGAASQAVQNMNLVTELPETMGLL